MKIVHEKLEVLKHRKTDYQDDELSIYCLCNAYLHGRITCQHFVTDELQHNSYLLFYVVKGQGVVYTNGELKGLKQNDLCLINFGSYYISSHDWEFIVLRLEGLIICEIIKAQFSDFLYSIKDKQYLEKQLSYLFNYMEKQDLLMISSHVQKILHDILKGNEQLHMRNHQTPIEQAKNYIENHFRNEIHLDDLSKYIGFSKYHFIRVFKKVMKITPYQYLLQVRLDYAQFLLRTSELSISEISKQCGFHSEMNFYQNFNKYIGVAPSRYRHLN